MCFTLCPSFLFAGCNGQLRNRLPCFGAELLRPRCACLRSEFAPLLCAELLHAGAPTQGSKSLRMYVELLAFTHGAGGDPQSSLTTSSYQADGKLNLNELIDSSSGWQLYF